MTAVFEAYAAYYDLLYRDKDYGAETDYVLGQLRSQGGAVTRVLELGCGSGGHALEFARRGVAVRGIDQSEGMLTAARRRAAAEGHAEGMLTFSRGDIRDFTVEGSFDAVVSLFHVFSYLATDDDLRRAFSCARRHLAPGGVFFFDAWYGPAVLADPPASRTRRMSDAHFDVLRQAEPRMFPDAGQVEVNYHVEVRRTSDGAVETIDESHRMRYLFTDDVARLLAECGLRLVRQRAWMSDEEPSNASWNACFLAVVD